MIPSIPTTYNGIQYRSRLEARWAFFLTLCGYQFTYEPLGYGSPPDFEIERIYLEIKGSMPTDEYINHLRKIGTTYLGIGGFFQYRSPTLIHIRANGIVSSDFYQVFPYRIFFNRACEHRFDLR